MSTFAYCRVCRNNHKDGKQHKYKQKHRIALEKTLTKEAQTVLEYRQLVTAPNIGTAANTTAWCIFCDCQINNVGTPVACYGMVHHLATKDHKKHVIEFLKDMGAANKEDRTKYLIHRGEFNQFVQRGKNGGQVNGSRVSSPSSSAPSSPPISISDTSTSSQYNDPSLFGTEDTAENVEDGATIAPQENARPRTVISKNGIKQNPTGWTEEGERVWGGGIIKYKKGQWIAWEIDMDDENNTFTAASLMGGAVPAAVPVRPLTGAGAAQSEGPLPKQTEFAFATNLTRIEQQPLVEGQGNVHSGATPPWMVDDSGSTIPTVPTAMTLTERERVQNKSKKVKNPKKIGANINRDATYSERTWVPNFGRVFNAGPRSESRKEFKDELTKRPQTLLPVPTTPLSTKEKLIQRTALELQGKVP